MAPKAKEVAKAEKPAAEEEPAAKKAKTDEEAKPEEPKFVEPDAADDKRPAIKEQVVFHTSDTTVNVMPTVGGKVLSCLQDGGMACLLAGARASVGVKSGRYMFEVKTLQNNPAEHGKFARDTLRIGFSTSSASLILGEDAHSVYFDSDGASIAAKKRSQLPQGSKFSAGTVAVVLNLDASSPNKNTAALYRNGSLIGSPVALPEDLQGKALFPHVTYRKKVIQVNFGPSPLKELPFKCRMVGGAATADVEVTKSTEPKDGKYNVVYPVALPEEGGFEWLDSFLEKNPGYTELSSRKIISWAQASGLPNQADKKGSNDSPAFAFGIREMDDLSARKVLEAFAPVSPRNYVVMHLKANLIADDRAYLIKKFNYPCYTKKAVVALGEPDADYKSRIQAKILKQKQARSDAEHKRKKDELAKKKAAAAAKKEREAKAAAAVEAAKKKREEEAAKKVAEKAAKEGEEKKDEEKKEEEVKKEEPKEEPKAEETKEEPAAEEEEELGEPPVAELTEDEKKLTHFRRGAFDMGRGAVDANFSKFAAPDKAEGFDAIEYVWQKADKAQEYLAEWIKSKKLTTKVEDIKPGDQFKERKAAFAKLEKEWKEKLAAWKKAGSKKPKTEDGSDEVDIFSVTDVADIGEGVPLFSEWTHEDWALLTLRYQFATLALAFKVDCNDPDRDGIPSDHINFYFNKYHNAGVTPKTYGVANVAELVNLIKDTASIKDGVLSCGLTEDLDSLDIFVKLTEEHRRERQRRIDAGDETARLKIEPPKPAPAPKPAAAAPKPAATAAKPAPAAAAAAPKGDKGKGKAKDAGKAWGKDQGKAKDQGKGWGKDGYGKDQSKGWGKDAGKGKDKGKDKGWGKVKGKW